MATDRAYLFGMIGVGVDVSVAGIANGAIITSSHREKT
jgi:hypothetical protein